MKVSMILAMDLNCLIGEADQLPWHNKEDLAYFKHYTTGKALLMGSSTARSLKTPLADRLNLVLSKTGFNVPGFHTATTFARAVTLAASVGYEELVIIGGKQVYESLIDEVDEIYVTVINAKYEGNVHLDHPLFKALAGIDLSPRNPFLRDKGSCCITLPDTGAVWTAGIVRRDYDFEKDIITTFTVLKRGE